MASKSTNYYRSNADALKVKQEYQREYNKKPSQKKKRAELNAINRKKGTYGNGEDKDWSHTKKGTVVSEGQSKNRARNRGKK